jgi:hypothetical protein
VKVPQIDTRLVQTAVIGGRDSDQPVILPEEPHNLDEFRRQFGTDRFWCGTLLGGCGEKLMTKRYETKVCHFSHYPDRQGNRTVCGRTANGVDSADHLFIKAHVTRWLTRQGHAPRAELRSLGHGPGDAVDFWLRATGQHLRFELRSEDYRNWRRAADSLGAKEGHIEWLFGSDCVITRDLVSSQGYALRVRCETEGNDRRVLVGTVTENRHVAWAPLEECRMTNAGLVTPTLEELRTKGIVRDGGMRNDPLPGSLSFRGAEVVFAVDGECRPPAESPFTTAGRHLVSGFVKPAGSRILRATLSLPEEIPVPVEQYVYRLLGSVRLLVTDAVTGEGPAWAIRADSLVQLNGLDAERTGLWRPSVALDERLETTRRTAPARTEIVLAAEPERSKAATLLRQALERVAEEGTTTTWQELARRIGLDLAHLPSSKRRDLLVEVDKPLSPEKPLLCVLILVGAGRPLPYLGTVLRLLGADAPASESALYRWAEKAIKKAHEAYRPTLTPTTSVAFRQGPVFKERPPSRGDLLVASRKVAAIQAKLREAAGVLPRAKDRRAARLSQAIEQGEAHVQQYDAARGKHHALRAWLRDDDLILNELDHLVGRPVASSADSASKPTGTPERIRTLTSVARERSDARSEQDQDQEAEDVAGQSEEPQLTAFAEARAEFERLVQQIRTAQKAGDLAAVDAARRRAGPLYARRLSPPDREEYTPFMREVKTWCREQDPEKSVDPSLRRIRQLLVELGRTRASRSADDLASTLDEIRGLRRRLSQPLPAAEDREVKRWRRQLKDQQPVRRGQQAGGASEPQHNERLPIETIKRLAPGVRKILIDAARSGGRLMTWGDLRRQMGGGLPHLHPDDQGELLVAVDRDTQADEPLLSTLIVSGDTSLHWLYRHIRFSLGRERIPTSELEGHWAAEVLRLRQIWRFR